MLWYEKKNFIVDLHHVVRITRAYYDKIFIINFYLSMRNDDYYSFYYETEQERDKEFEKIRDILME